MSVPNQVSMTLQATANIPFGTGSFLQAFSYSPQIPGFISSAVTAIGSGAGQVNAVYVGDSIGPVNNGTPLAIDLFAVNQPDGSAANFIHVSHLLFVNLDGTNLNTITVTPDASKPVSFIPPAGLPPTPPPLMSGSTIVQANVALITNSNGWLISSTTGGIKLTSSGGTNALAKMLVLVYGRNA